MRPEAGPLRRVCAGLHLERDVIRSIAEMEREEGADYAAVEIVAALGQQLPEWAAELLYKEFSTANGLLADLLNEAGFKIPSMRT